MLRHYIFIVFLLISSILVYNPSILNIILKEKIFIIGIIVTFFIINFNRVFKRKKVMYNNNIVYSHANMVALNRDRNEL